MVPDQQVAAGRRRRRRCVSGARGAGVGARGRPDRAIRICCVCAPRGFRLCNGSSPDGPPCLSLTNARRSCAACGRRAGAAPRWRLLNASRFSCRFRATRRCTTECGRYGQPAGSGAGPGARCLRVSPGSSAVSATQQQACAGRCCCSAWLAAPCGSSIHATAVRVAAALLIGAQDARQPLRVPPLSPGAPSCLLRLLACRRAQSRCSAPTG